MLSLQIPLRLLRDTQPHPMAPVFHVVHRVLTHFLLKQARLKPDQADGGKVTLIVRMNVSRAFC